MAVPAGDASSRAVFELIGVLYPVSDETEVDLDGEGGGNAREGNLAIGRKDLSGVEGAVVLVALSLYINLE